MGIWRRVVRGARGGRPVEQMMRRRLFAAVLAFGVAAAASVGAQAPTTPLLLGEGDRLLVLAPHPDDETLATGGLIQEALALDLPVQVCFFTMGDNNEIAFLFTRKHPVLMPGAVRSMGNLRQNEAIAAATQLGLSTNQLVFLGYPDYGTLDIWLRHWRDTPPFRSMLTRVNAVPYDRALTPGSAYAGEDILDDLMEVIRDFQPTMIAVSHPADHNVDHRALYLFTRVALWNLEPDSLSPEILAYPVHFTHWPEPRRYHPMRPASPPHFLLDGIDWLEYELAPFQVTNKRAALRRHHSQYLYSAAYLDSFIRKSELFGDVPDIPLPRGIGRAEHDEEDASQFRTDDDLFEELSRHSDQWRAIAEQNAAEAAALGDHDNDFARQAVSGDGQYLTLSFEFRRPVSGSTRLHVHLFGHRADVPFGEMPKIEITATPRKVLSVQDLQAKLPDGSVELLPGGGDQIQLRVPFALLGSPERILAGARLSTGTLPVDWLAWRVIDLSGEPSPGPDPATAIAAAPPPPAPPAPSPAPVPEAPAPAPRIPRATSPAPGPEPPESLTPRVRLPRNTLPDRTEANEPVFW